MHRAQNGDYAVSPEEMHLLRQGLFVTKHHLDPLFVDDLQTITGATAEEFSLLLQRVDALGES